MIDDAREGARPDPLRFALPALGVVLAFAFRGLLHAHAPSLHRDIAPSERIFFVVSETPPAIVYGLFAWMVFERRHHLRAALGTARPAYALGAAFLAPALALQVWSRYVSAPDLLIPALSLTLLGGAALLGGRSAARVIALPAVFLLFALPIPAPLVNALVFPLQLATTASTAAVLDLAGMSVLSRGDMILSGDHIFHVIETCSGLRAIETLMMAAVLFVDMFYVNRLHTALLLLATPLIAFAVNLLRVITMVLNPYSEIVAVHSLQGIVALVIGVLAIAGVDRLLRAVPGVGSKAPRRSLDGAPAPRSGAQERGSLSVLGATVALMALASVATPVWPIPSQTPRALGLELPGAVETGERWTSQPSGVPGEFLGSVGYLNFLSRVYRPQSATSDERDVQLQIFGSPRIERRTSLISAKIPYPGAGSERLERNEPVSAGGLVGEASIFRTSTDTQLVHCFETGVDSTFEEIVRALFALDRGFTRRGEEAWYYRLSTRIDPRSGGLPGARERLGELATALQAQGALPGATP